MTDAYIHATSDLNALRIFHRQEYLKSYSRRRRILVSKRYSQTTGKDSLVIAVRYAGEKIHAPGRRGCAQDA